MAGEEKIWKFYVNYSLNSYLNLAQKLYSSSAQEFGERDYIVRGLFVWVQRNRTAVDYRVSRAAGYRLQAIGAYLSRNDYHRFPGNSLSPPVW
ncbi:hypothetical protein O3M35_010926 [Rhynocoris fuscipes]|uniref:Uncharacterized protein n=1 Tax=Rhynocoris fuscipes TaxID=488301 RepID=A0AAW1D7V8_9HEMI